MRVAASIVPDVLNGIQQSEQALQTALQELSTGKRVNLPSDDPAASAALVRNQTEQSNVDQYTQNIDAVLARVQTASSTLNSVITALNQAVSLGTQGANGTLSGSDRQAIAQQVEGVISTVAAQANTTYQGAYLFGGTASGSAPFTSDGGSPATYAYQGNSGVNTVTIGDGLDIPTNVPGDQIFTGSSSSVFGALQQLATALQSGSATDIGNATSAVTSALNYVSQQQVIYSNTTSQLNAQETFLQQETVTLQSQENSLVGIDSATAATDVSQAETQNSAVLAAAAKVLPNTLLNYLSQPM